MDAMNRRRFLTGTLAGAGSLILLPHAAKADFYIRSRRLDGRSHVYLTDLASYYGMRVQRSGDDFVLLSRQRRLDLSLNRRRALVNGLVLDLGFPVKQDQGTVLVAEIDLQQQLDPILRPWAQPRRRIQRIVIDPGHGDHDPGTKGDRHKEKDIVLDLSRRLHRALTARGYDVSLTRSSDVFLELADRPAIAARQRADLFLSVHVNSAGANRSPDGIETFFATPRGLPPTGQNEPESDTCDGNRFDGLNCRLAFDLHRSLINTTNATDRGLKRSRWRVLKTAPCPAVLLELGFLSNPEEERRLASAAYQQRLTDAITAGVVTYTANLAARS